MSLLRNSSMGGATDNYTVMFEDLSPDAQEKLLSLNISDLCWQMLPLAHLYENKNALDQDAIDEAALLTQGYYHAS